MTPPTKREAETQAKELASDLSYGSCLKTSPEALSKLTNLFIKAGEKDELAVYKNTAELHIEAKDKAVENWRKANTILKEERNSLLEKLELAEGEIDVILKQRDTCLRFLAGEISMTDAEMQSAGIGAATNIEQRHVCYLMKKERDPAQAELKEMAKTPQVDAAIGTPHQLTRLIELNKKLERNLNVAQADCAVKHEALKNCFHHLGKEIGWKTLKQSADDGTQKISREIAEVLDSTNPGQKLLDELKLSNEKAEALDWWELNHDHYFNGKNSEGWWIEDLELKLVTEKHTTFLSAITQARKEQGK